MPEVGERAVTDPLTPPYGAGAVRPDDEGPGPVRPDDGEDGDEEIPARRRHTRRWVVLGIVAVVVLAGAGIGIWAATSGGTTAGPTITNSVVTVSTGTIQKTVATTGTIEPANQANVNFAASGRVTAVNVAVGQKVTQGQVLATIDNASLQEAVDSATATVDSDQSKLASDQQDNASAAQIAADQSAVTAAQDQLSTAQSDLADASLTAPIAGTVASMNLTVGQQVTGSGSSGDSGGQGATGNTGSGSSGFGGSAGTGSAGTGSAGSGSGDSSSAQIVIIGTGSYVVNASVDDTDVAQISQGDQAIVTLQGSSGSSGESGAGGFAALAGGGTSTSSTSGTYYGTVTSIGLIATSSSGVATFPVTVTITGTPSGLYPGAEANVSVVVQQLSGVTEVPTAALRYANGQAEVVVVQGGHDVTKVVTVGQAANGETQILSGVTSGQKVVEQVVSFHGFPGGASRTGGGVARFGGFGGAGFGGGGFSGFGGGGGGFVVSKGAP